MTEVLDEQLKELDKIQGRYSNLQSMDLRIQSQQVSKPSTDTPRSAPEATPNETPKKSQVHDEEPNKKQQQSDADRVVVTEGYKEPEKNLEPQDSPLVQQSQAQKLQEQSFDSLAGEPRNQMPEHQINELKATEPHTAEVDESLDFKGIQGHRKDIDIWEQSEVSTLAPTDNQDTLKTMVEEQIEAPQQLQGEQLLDQPDTRTAGTAGSIDTFMATSEDQKLYSNKDFTVLAQPPVTKDLSAAGQEDRSTQMQHLSEAQLRPTKDSVISNEGLTTAKDKTHDATQELLQDTEPSQVQLDAQVLQQPESQLNDTSKAASEMPLHHKDQSNQSEEPAQSATGIELLGDISETHEPATETDRIGDVAAPLKSAAETDLLGDIAEPSSTETNQSSAIVQPAIKSTEIESMGEIVGSRITAAELDQSDDVAALTKSVVQPPEQASETDELEKNLEHASTKSVVDSPEPASEADQLGEVGEVARPEEERNQIVEIAEPAQPAVVADVLHVGPADSGCAASKSADMTCASSIAPRFEEDCSTLTVLTKEAMLDNQGQNDIVQSDSKVEKDAVMEPSETAEQRLAREAAEAAEAELKILLASASAVPAEPSERQQSLVEQRDVEVVASTQGFGKHGTESSPEQKVKPDGDLFEEGASTSKVHEAEQPSEQEASPPASEENIATQDVLPIPKPPATREAQKSSSLVSQRAAALEEACKSASASVNQQREKVVAARMRRYSGGGAVQDSVKQLSRAELKLSNTSEQRVLKTGITRLRDVLVSRLTTNLADVPEYSQGSKLLRRATLIRLIDQEVELKSCMEMDICSAQSDVRHLTSEQLLVIRTPTLDFATESGTHSARNSFLETVDKHLFYKLAKQFIVGDVSLPQRPEPLHALGIRVALVVGASELIASGWGRKTTGGSLGDHPKVSPIWVIKLTEDDWPDRCTVAIFHTNSLWLELLTGEKPDVARPAGGEMVTVLCDRTVGIGRDRMLHWEIAILDPRVDDVMAEMACKDTKNEHKTQLNQELFAKLARRANMVATVFQSPAKDASNTSGIGESPPAHEMSMHGTDEERGASGAASAPLPKMHAPQDNPRGTPISKVSGAALRMEQCSSEMTPPPPSKSGRQAPCDIPG